MPGCDNTGKDVSLEAAWWGHQDRWGKGEKLFGHRWRTPGADFVLLLSFPYWKGRFWAGEGDDGGAHLAHGSQDTGAGGCEQAAGGWGMKAQGPGGGSDRSSAEAASTARCSEKGWGEGREKRPSAKRAKAAEEKRAWPERQR